MDDKQRKELIKSILLLVVIIAISVFFVRVLLQGETLTEYRENQLLEEMQE